MVAKVGDGGGDGVEFVGEAFLSFTLNLRRFFRDVVDGFGEAVKHFGVFIVNAISDVFAFFSAKEEG